jgi:hypothetical protein
MSAEKEKHLIRPYGDRRDDGVIQLSFVLPVPSSEKAKEAAATVAKKLGLSHVLVSAMEQAGENYSFFVVYGRTHMQLDYNAIEVPEVLHRKHGFDELFIATNYKSEYIANFMGDGRQFGVKTHYSREMKPLGTCGPLSSLREQLDTPFILMNGDILTTIDFHRFYEYADAQESDFTVGTKNIITPFSFGKVHIDGNRIIKVEEKPEIYTEIVAGIYFMRPAILSAIPDDTYFGIDNLIELMLREGRPITRYLIEEYWLDIGRVEDYSVAEEAYTTHFKKS